LAKVACQFRNAALVALDTIASSAGAPQVVGTGNAIYGRIGRAWQTLHALLQRMQTFFV
jgi:hypothetical protein